MTDLRETLLEFHAAYRPEELKAVPAYDALCRAREGEHDFELARTLVAEVNGALDGGLRSADGHVGQVMAAVATAKGFARQARQLEVLRELVRRRYGAAWSPEQMAYFQAASRKLETWRDYFLSFTNFNPWAPGAINMVNLRHQFLIATGGGMLVKHPEAVEHNLLAKALDNWLSYQLVGFFWEKHQEPAEVVKERLSKEAAQSFVFVQVLQNTLFSRDPGEHFNYCLLEYTAANTDPSRVLVLWAEPADSLIKLGAIRFAEFRDWYSGLKERTRIELPPVNTPQDALSELDRIVAIVKKQLDAAHRRLVSGVPG